MKHLLLFCLLIPLCCTGQWVKMGNNINGDSGFDLLGSSTALSDNGEIFAVGAVNLYDIGYVRVYDWNGFDWIQKGNDIVGQGIDDRFGESISLSSNGDIIAIGGSGNDTNGNNSGHVRIFKWNNSNWEQLGLDIIGENEGDLLGKHISLSSEGNRIAVSSILYDVKKGLTNYTNSGKVVVYEWDGINWVQLGLSINGSSAYENIGRSLCLSNNGNRLAVGATPSYQSTNGRDFTKVFDYDGSKWIQIGSTIYGENSEDGTGTSVSLSLNGSKLAIGAPYTNNGGQVRVYNFVNNNWVQIGSDIESQELNNYFGYSVSISSSGDYLAIGIPRNNSNGNYSGQLRIFNNINNNWVLVDSVINGTNVEDEFGYSVSISKNGEIVASGARNNSSYFGRANIFSTNSHLALIEVIDDISGNNNGINITAKQLNNIIGVNGAIDDVNYTTALQKGVFSDIKNPKANEIQEVVNTVNNSLGIDYKNLSRFKFYPNPTKNVLNIELNKGLELKQVNIYTLEGRYLYSVKNKKVYVKNLTSGMYVFEIETNQGKSAKKIVIE